MSTCRWYPPDSSSGTIVIGENPSARARSTTAPTCGCWTSTQVSSTSRPVTRARTADTSGGDRRLPERVGRAVRAQHQRRAAHGERHVASHSSTPASSCFFTSSGATLARTDDAASAASGGVVHAVIASGGGVLGEQAGPEQQRVVGAEGDGGARLDERGKRHVGERGEHAERDVARRAHLERDAGVDHALQHRGVLAGPHAVADPGGGQVVQGHLDVVGTEQLAAVRHPRQAGATGEVEGRGELGGPAAPLVVRQAEPDDGARPLALVPDGEPGQGAGVERVPDPAGRHHDGDLRTGGEGRPRGPRRARSRAPG